MGWTAEVTESAYRYGSMEVYAPPADDITSAIALARASIVVAALAGGTR